MDIILLHDVDEEHLAEVTESMMEQGAPTIHAIWDPCYDAWVALEGTHRIAAAHKLGLTPEIDEVEYDDVSDMCVRELPWNDLDNDFTVGELVDRAGYNYNAGLFRRFA